MADFKTHVSFGIALGILGVIGSISTALGGGSAELLALFIAATLGSILPDIDSDSGIPFHTVFGSLSLIFGTLTLIDLSRQATLSLSSVLIRSAGVSLFVWLIVGTIFKHFTKHRGMAHSIPGAVLSGLVAFFIASSAHFSEKEAFIIGNFVLLGYLIHLLLDEMYAAVNFDGIPFIPKHSLGTAMKLFSHSFTLNVILYGVIASLCIGNLEKFTLLSHDIWSEIQYRK
ncbi:MAG: metal-dependent hydrolase [Candidatus Moraniibacteriota bacterium]